MTSNIFFFSKHLHRTGKTWINHYIISLNNKYQHPSPQPQYLVISALVQPRLQLR